MSDKNVNIRLTETPEDTLSGVIVGRVPYILITVDDVTDNEVSLGIQVGGGTPAEPVDEVAEFLSMVGHLLVSADVVVTPLTEDDEDEDADS
jgi:hypothetical protein